MYAIHRTAMLALALAVPVTLQAQRGMGPRGPRAGGNPVAPIIDMRRELNLTPRQLEVLALLCEGLPNKLICRRLNIATGTVKVHISSILRELGVTSRVQAVVAAARHGVSGGDRAGTPPTRQEAVAA